MAETREDPVAGDDRTAGGAGPLEAAPADPAKAGHPSKAGRPIRERHHAHESPEYRLLAWGLFPLFLLAAVLVRVLTLGRGRLVARDRARQSVVAEARAVADTILPWAFSKG